MIFCARGTRTIGMCSFDARSGRFTAPIPEEHTSELGGSIFILFRRIPRSLLRGASFTRCGLAGQPFELPAGVFSCLLHVGIFKVLAHHSSLQLANLGQHD